MGLAISWLHYYPAMYNSDAALFLQAAQLLLQGKRLYLDILVVNPPLIIYLSTVPVYLAKLLSLNYLPLFTYLSWGLPPAQA